MFSMYNYSCPKCGWQGNSPGTAHEEYEDGGYPCCPEGCIGDDGEPEAAVININSDLGFRMLKKVFG